VKKLPTQERYFLPASDGVLDPNMAGALVCWELPSERADASELAVAVGSTGLKYLPSPPTPGAALQAMVAKQCQDRNQLVKSTDQNPDGSNRVAYSVYPRQKVAGRDGFVAEWTVGHTVVDLGGGVLDPQLAFTENVPVEVMEELLTLWPHYLNTLGSTEISGYLVELVKGAFRGVPPMGGSGTYFIGPEEVGVWKSLREALKPFGVSLHHLPAMRGSDALQFVAASVERYIQDSQAELEADLQKYQELQSQPAADAKKTKRLQERTLRDRSEKVQRQLDLVQHYESVLGTSLQSLRDGLTGLQAGFGALSIAEVAESMASVL